MLIKKQTQVSDTGFATRGVSPVPAELRGQTRRSANDDYLAEANARFSAQLHAVAEGITGDADLAKDAVQEALLALWQADDMPISLYGWLYRAVVHRSLHTRRTEWRRRNRERHADNHHLGEPGHDPMEIVNVRQTANRLSLAIDALAPGIKDVFLQREWRGLDYHSIARVANVPIGTVRSRLKRARHSLMRIVATDGGVQ